MSAEGEGGHSPLSQFVIKKILHLELFGVDVSITNSAIFMIVATSLIVGFFWYATTNMTSSAYEKPSKSQLMAEGIFSFVNNMLRDTAGEKATVFLSLICTLFLFILSCNILGMIPYGFTVTSHLSVTLLLAVLVFLVVIVTGFRLHGMKFFHIFLPDGTPAMLAPLMVFVEVVAFFARPISLSLRLTANMVAGHVLLKVMAGFIVALPMVAKIFPAAIVIAVIGFEIFVSLLQAYIFAILSCVYLNDAINLH